MEHGESREVWMSAMELMYFNSVEVIGNMVGLIRRMY